MKRAVYRPACEPHYGLASSAYAHFTSPIRRYPDLVVHRMLKAQLTKRSERFDQEVAALPWIAEHSSDMERVAEKAARESQEIKIIEYLQAFVGQSFSAVVSGVATYGLYVRLDNTAEGLVPVRNLGPEYFAFDPVQHRLTGQDTGATYRLGQRLAVVFDVRRSARQAAGFPPRSTGAVAGAMGRMRETAQAMARQMHSNKRTFAVYVVLRLIVVACAASALVFGNYEAFFLCLLTLVLFLVPAFVEVNFSITIPETLEVIIVLFIFAAEILGELLHFYTIFPFWDTLLHTFNGFLAAAIGLALVSILNRSDRIAFSLVAVFLRGGGVLLLDDHRRALGVLRIRHGSGVRPGHAKGCGGHQHRERALGSRGIAAPCAHRRDRRGCRERSGAWGRGLP